jgi:hypothetical protein
MKYLLITGLCIGFGVLSGLFLRPRLRSVWYELVMEGIMAGVCLSCAMWFTTFNGIYWIIFIVPSGIALIAGIIYICYIVGGVCLHNTSFAEYRSKQLSSRD